jgi:CubicO group peptidase (beta-lactamase class C family)
VQHLEQQAIHGAQPIHFLELALPGSRFAGSAESALSAGLGPALASCQNGGYTGSAVLKQGGMVMKVLLGLILALLPVQSSFAQTPEASIDKLFARFQDQSPGCAIGVSQDGKVLVSKAYGMADLEHDIPITPKSLFYMASVSKQFAAMSVLMLVDEGKLHLEDSIRKTIPELPDYANDITIYQLLTHTSGVRDYLTPGPRPVTTLGLHNRPYATLSHPVLTTHHITHPA